MNRGLVAEIVRMALETLRANKLQSGLTVLGVVIGITSIVGVTSLIRGFDQSIRASINELGPTTIFLNKFSELGWPRATTSRRSCAGRTSPSRTPRRLKSWPRRSRSVDIWLGAQNEIQERVFYGGQKHTRADR